MITFSSLDDPSLNVTEICERLNELQKELQTTKQRVDLIERSKLENDLDKFTLSAIHRWYSDIPSRTVFT